MALWPNIFIVGKRQVLSYGSPENRGSTGLLKGNLPTDYRRKEQNPVFAGFCRLASAPRMPQKCPYAAFCEAFFFETGFFPTLIEINGYGL